jgi:hypothetical protein
MARLVPEMPVSHKPHADSVGSSPRDGGFPSLEAGFAVGDTMDFLKCLDALI